MTPAPPKELDTETVESRSFKFKSSIKKKERKVSQAKKPSAAAKSGLLSSSSLTTKRDSAHRRGASGGHLPQTASTLHRDRKSRGKHAHPLSKSTETILFHSDNDPNPIVPNKNPGTPDVWVPRTIRA